MKKTLFLSAILGAALCSTAYAEAISTTSVTPTHGTTIQGAITLASTNGEVKGLTEKQDATVLYNSQSGTKEYFFVTTGALANAGKLIIGSGTYGEDSTSYAVNTKLRLGHWGDGTSTGDLIVADDIIMGVNNADYGMRIADCTTSGGTAGTVLINGNLVLLADSKIAVDKTVAANQAYLNGKLQGGDYSLTFGGNGNGVGTFQFAGGGQVGTFVNVDGVAITLKGTARNGSALSDEAKSYTFGTLKGNITVEDGVTLTIKKGIDGKVTNNGTLNFTGTVDVTATGGSDERITEDANAYSTLLFTREIATTGGTINAEGVEWTINGKEATETALTDGTFSGRVKTTTYYVNEGGTINYTADSALADTTATSAIIVGATTTFNIASGAVLQKNRLTANAATTLTGSGTYEVAGWSDMAAPAPGNMLTNVTLSGSDLTLRIVGGSFKGIDLDDAKFGSATLELKGITGGYIKTWAGGTLNRNLKLTNNGNSAAWVWTDGQENSETIQTFAGTWSGDGNFLKHTDNRKEGFTWTGDISAWTGQLRIISDTDTTLTFGGSADTINVREIRKEHTGNLNINFTSDNNMTVANSIVKEGGTIVINANANVNFGKAVAADTMTVAAGKTVSLAGNAHTIGSLTINGTVETSKNGNANGFVSGDVTVKAGGTLSVVGGGQDALGWSSSATSSLTLLGSEEAKATFGLNYTGTGSLTLETALNMSGHSQVNGNRSFNTYGGVITATGTDNVISAGMQLRSAASIVVEEGGELLISGTVISSSEGGAAYSLTKTGAGLLTISGNISGSGSHTPQGGTTIQHLITLTGDGANTVIASGTIGNATLKNVTLSNAAHTFTDTVELQGSSAKLGQHISLKGDLTLTGGTTIEMNDAGTGKGIWMEQGKTLTIDSTSTLSVAGDISLTGTAQNATVTATGTTNQIGTNSAYHNTVNIANAAVTVLGSTLREYKISGGSVTVGDNKGDVTVNSTLSGETAVAVGEGSTATFTQVASNVASLSGAGSVIVAENKDLTVAGDSAIGALSGAGSVALGGNLTVAGDVTLNSLTIAAGKEVTVNDHAGTLALQNLTVNGDATVNANLVLGTQEHGADITLKGTLTMGCDVTIASGSTLTVDGDVTSSLVTLFKGVDNLTLGSGDPVAMGWYNASTVLSRLTYNAETASPQTISGSDLNDYVIGYWNGTVTISEKSIPEPATATLSLLALAGLCARRKRK